PVIGEGGKGRLAYQLRGSSFGIQQALNELDTLAGRSILLIVDQFEEIFRYGQSGTGAESHDRAAMLDEKVRFVQLLLEAGRSGESNVHVLITMRSDFIGDCAQFQGLPEAVSASQFLVPSLTRDQLEEAILLPIRKAGATIESSLVDRLLNESRDDVDRLPVLQHCLQRLWEGAGKKLVAAGAASEEAGAQTSSGAARHLTQIEYEGIRGVSGALSHHADEILSGLAGLERQVEQTFRALSE